MKIEAEQFYFSTDRHNIFRVRKNPLYVQTSLNQDSGADEEHPLNTSHKYQDSKIGQFTFAVNVGFLGKEEQVRFRIPKSEKDGADLPSIVFPNGLTMIHPRLSREIWDEAYNKAIKEILAAQREERNAENAYSARKYGPSKVA